MTYEAWRISYQSSEQAARAAYAECVRLRARLEAAEKERDELLAKSAEMERQEPVAWCSTDETGTVIEALGMNQSRRFDTPLFLAPGAQPAPSFADAYQGAMEEVAIWKRRALEAEDLNRKFIAEINGPMHMGEPAQPAPSIPEGWKEGVEAVAAMLQEKADDYANEYGHDDRGGLSFGGGMCGQIKMDYYSNLVELTEEVRAMLTATSEEAKP